MNPINTALGAAFAAAALACGAFAADPAGNKSDSSKVMPAREDLKPGAAPSVERMDDNAQRQHDRNSGTDSKASKTGANRDGGGTARMGNSSQRGDKPAARVDPSLVRDWSAIDKNKDHSIGPQEMEEWLKTAGPKKS